MRQLSTIIAFSLRNLRTKKAAEPQVQPVPKPDKIKFTEEQITQMGQYRTKAKARNFGDIFHDKIQQKKENQYLKKQKEQIKEDDMDFQEEQDQQTLKMQKKNKQNTKEQLKTFKIYKHLEMMKKKAQGNKKQGLQTQFDVLERLSKVRLTQQYLPYEYMKQVQKVFHKYDQNQLRDIAFHFTNLMKLRYNEQKINYEQYPNLNFQKLQEKLPSHRRVEQIYLTSKQKIFEDRQQEKKIDSQPIEPEIKYSQNIVVSYMLNRLPRTYAVAYRALNQIKNMFPSFKPTSFIDFGAGLSPGSAAFVELFGQGSVYSVQPAGKMRKMAKYLTNYSKIVHFESLAELSSQVRQVDVIYCGYVLNEIRPELITIYLESLFQKIKVNGFLVLVEYGNPYGARLIHQARKWALGKSIKIVAPCPHQNKCPLANSKHWCHFDQPTGMYPREVFGKLPSDNSIKLQKYSYLIIQKLKADQNAPQTVKVLQPNVTQEWDRVLFPLIRRGQHFIFNLCTKDGHFDKRITGKSHGEEYKFGRRLRWGDFWRFGKRIPNKFRKERKTGRRLW